jgi:exodeoxyribonuclease VII large subunit
VQGDSAAPEIVEAIRALNDMADVDVIIIARGGGSLEELWPFNEEAVARAIYGSRVAVISGVGHETDVTIADLVADYRAPTPSAAAEVSVPDAARLQDHVAALQRTAFGIVDQMVSQRRQQLDYLVRQLRGRGPQVQIFQQRVDDLTQALARGLSSTLALAKERFAGIEQHLSALNPTAILERGYSYVQRTADSTPVTSVAQVHPDDALHITVSDGSFDVRAV